MLPQFWTLKYVDPATYQILGNLKIVTTGVLFRLLLQRRLSLLQWIALVLLMVGATTSQVHIHWCEWSQPWHRGTTGQVHAHMAMLWPMRCGADIFVIFSVVEQCLEADRHCMHLICKLSGQ